MFCRRSLNEIFGFLTQVIMPVAYGNFPNKWKPIWSLSEFCFDHHVPKHVWSNTAGLDFVSQSYPVLRLRAKWRRLAYQEKIVQARVGRKPGRRERFPKARPSQQSLVRSRLMRSPLLEKITGCERHARSLELVKCNSVTFEHVCRSKIYQIHWQNLKLTTFCVGKKKQVSKAVKKYVQDLCFFW